MRYLFFTNTPAHVHLYRNAVERLRDRGHAVLVLARDYGCTVDLLEWFGLPFEVYGRCDTSKGSLFRRLPRHYLACFRRAWRFDPDLIFGMGGYAAHTGLVTGTPAVLVVDSEPTSLDHAVSTPFATAVLTPDAFRKDLGESHFAFDGFKECAYLHPEEYDPDPAIRDRLGVAGDERYVLLRLNAFGSHHDVGEGGFSRAQCATLVDRLATDATVFVSDEGGKLDLSAVDARPFDVHPALMHDAIHDASLLVADTQTIVTEAALLGTPVVRSNSFVGEDDMGNFVELEDAGLVRNVAAFDDVLATAESLLADSTAGDRWERRRESFLEDRVNLTRVLVDVATDGSLTDVRGLRRWSVGRDAGTPAVSTAADSRTGEPPASREP